MYLQPLLHHHLSTINPLPSNFHKINTCLKPRNINLDFVGVGGCGVSDKACLVATTTRQYNQFSGNIRNS